MGADVDAGPGRKFRRPHVIEEDERPYPLPTLVGQRPAHGEIAEIPRLGLDEQFDQVLFGHSSLRFQCPMAAASERAKSLPRVT